MTFDGQTDPTRALALTEAVRLAGSQDLPSQTVARAEAFHDFLTGRSPGQAYADGVRSGLSAAAGPIAQAADGLREAEERIASAWPRQPRPARRQATGTEGTA